MTEQQGPEPTQEQGNPQQQQQEQVQSQESQGPQEQQQEQQNTQTYTQDYVSGLRNEAASYRTQRNAYREALEAAGYSFGDDGSPVPPGQRSSQGTRSEGQQQEDSGQSPELEALRRQNEALQQRIRQDSLSRTAEQQAIAIGARPERAAYVARLANLGDIRFDDQDRPDTVQVQEAITAVLNDVPELRVSSAQQGSSGQSVGGGGSRPGGGGTNNQPSVEQQIAQAEEIARKSGNPQDWARVIALHNQLSTG